MRLPCLMFCGNFGDRNFVYLCSMQANGNELQTLAPQMAPQTATQTAPQTHADGDEALLRLWLSQYESPETLRSYEREIRKLLAYFAKPISAITLRDLHAYAIHLRDGGLKPSSQRRALMVIKSLFAFAAKVGYLRWDIAKPLKTPKEVPTLTGRILGEGEVLRLMHAPKRLRDRLIIRTLYETGLRISELCALTWEKLQFDAEGGAVAEVIGKGSKVRYVRLSPKLVSELRKLAQTGPLFATQWRRMRRPMTPQQMRNLIANAAKEAGLAKRVSPHWLRHCAATHALRRGLNIADVAAILGHSSIAVTQRYLHASPKVTLADYLPS